MSNLHLTRSLLPVLALLAGNVIWAASAQAAPKGGHGHKPAPAHKPGHTHKPAHTHKPGHGHKNGHVHKTGHVHKNGHVHNPVNGHKAATKYAQSHGVKLKSGHYAYKGINHQHWTRRHYSPRSGRWFWYDPSTSGWYYWSSAKGYYLPTSYLSVVAPSGSELPPGASEVPLAEAGEIPDLPEPY